MRARSWLVGAALSVVAFLAGGLALPAHAAQPASSGSAVGTAPDSTTRAATQAQRAGDRAQAAAADLQGAVIPAAKKAAKKARKAATRAHLAAQALRVPGASTTVTQLVVTAQTATDKAKAAAKAAKKWAKRIDRRLAMCPATARACVDLTNSMSWLQKNGEVTYGPVKITSGRAGLRTRIGTWTVYWKHQNHVSGYYGTPMPNAIFFDHVGIAFHQGSLKELSHGCVHLGSKASQAYWNALGNGDTVYVFGYAPYSAGQTTV